MTLYKYNIVRIYPATSTTIVPQYAIRRTLFGFFPEYCDISPTHNYWWESHLVTRWCMGDAKTVKQRFKALQRPRQQQLFIEVVVK